MSAFAADLDLIEELITAMAGLERHLAAASDDVDARVRRVQSVWTGPAAADCARAHARWAAGARDMHEALTVLRSIATTARGNYESAVRANTAMWAL